MQSKTQGSRPGPRTQKKIRGQGQPFRGQTLSRPRTGMLEAKDQGHKRKCSPKKKIFTKIFQAISKKKKVFTKTFHAISTKKRFPRNFSSPPQNFNDSKNSAVLEPRTGQFSRTLGLEAKAKNLTFEAKAKDFKMCPRGQRRPRGLHLCKILINQCYFRRTKILAQLADLRLCTLMSLRPYVPAPLCPCAFMSRAPLCLRLMSCALLSAPLML